MSATENKPQESPKGKKYLVNKQYNNRYRVVGYLPPRYITLFNNYVGYTEESESSLLTQMVKKFFDGMPEQERQRILNYSKNSY